LLLYQRRGGATSTTLVAQVPPATGSLYGTAARFVVATHSNVWGLSCGSSFTQQVYPSWRRSIRAGFLLLERRTAGRASGRVPVGTAPFPPSVRGRYRMLCWYSCRKKRRRATG
jgi:hypothetical protein